MEFKNELSFRDLYYMIGSTNKVQFSRLVNVYCFRMRFTTEN